MRRNILSYYIRSYRIGPQISHSRYLLCIFITAENEFIMYEIESCWWILSDRVTWSNWALEKFPGITKRDWNTSRGRLLQQRTRREPGQARVSLLLMHPWGGWRCVPDGPPVREQLYVHKWWLVPVQPKRCAPLPTSRSHECDLPWEQSPN